MFTTEKNSSKEKKNLSEKGQTMATAVEKPLRVVGEKANHGETIDGESWSELNDINLGPYFSKKGH